MNRERACKILNVDTYKPDWEQTIKKKYHEKARVYHPDKNKSVGSEDKFKELNEAYTFLNNQTAKNTSFLKVDLVQIFIGLCEHHAIQMIEKMEYAQFQKIYKLILQYKHLFTFSPDFYNFMEKKQIFWLAQGDIQKARRKEMTSSDCSIIYDEDLLDENKLYKQIIDSEWNSKYYKEVQKDSSCNELKETMILRPSMENVLTDNVYIYKNEDDTFIIPLWHQELIFEHDQKEFIVKINPKMPSTNFWIDNANHLHQRIHYTLFELWDCVAEDKPMEVHFGHKRVLFYPNRIKLQSEQIWRWNNEGIPLINHLNMYDISKRADLVLHINISGIG